MKIIVAAVVFLSAIIGIAGSGGADNSLPVTPNKVLTQPTELNDGLGPDIEIVRVIHNCYVVMPDYRQGGLAPIPCPTSDDLQG